jgi:cation diffusion facilitator CzcD-associated flavoprotein CzcO
VPSRFTEPHATPGSFRERYRSTAIPVRRFPGLTCDIPSQLYSFSFRPWPWSRRFPARDEILAYLHALVAEHNLGLHLRFGRGVAIAEFDERHAVWTLTLDDGDTLQASAVVCAVGQLGRPVLPDIPGRGEFAGPPTARPPATP